jgi:hypothetical protein
MFAVLVILAAVFGYFLVGGIQKGLHGNKHLEKCAKCTSNHRCEDYNFDSALSGFFWPFSMPMAIGQAVSNRSERKAVKGKRKSEQTRLRREEELAEARHQSGTVTSSAVNLLTVLRSRLFLAR